MLNHLDQMVIVSGLVERSCSGIQHGFLVLRTRIAESTKLVFLAYFKKERERVEAIQQLYELSRNAEDKKILTSVLSVTEVALKGMEDANVKRLDEFWLDSSLIVLGEYHYVLAQEARQLVRSQNLDPRDAIRLATAIRHKSIELLTYDDDLLNLADTFTFIKEPSFNGQLSFLG